MVAQIIGKKLLELGHEVMISSRDINKDKGSFPSAKNWASDRITEGFKAHANSFEDAAKFGEIVINCTSGSHSIEALTLANEKNLENKILIDLANPLDFSKGMPPSLTISNTTSLGEEIQKAFPKVKVVKVLNTINAEVMVNPGIIQGEHDLLISGNDREAKEKVIKEILKDGFGWKTIIDLGDITASRGMEMYLPLWVRLMTTLKTPHFNIHVNIKKEGTS